MPLARDIRFASDIAFGSDIRFASDIAFGSDIRFASDIAFGSDIRLRRVIYAGANWDMGPNSAGACYPITNQTDALALIQTI